jgi:hypothetical protein
LLTISAFARFAVFATRPFALSEVGIIGARWSLASYAPLAPREGGSGWDRAGIHR